MTDGDALLRAILADPADDAPRLAYADWLDEQGREAQAGWVRAGVRSRKPFFHPVGCLAPWSRCRHDPNWKPQYRAGGPAWVWHRGFVDIAREPLAELLANGPALAAVQPVAHFEVTDRSPWFDRVDGWLWHEDTFYSRTEFWTSPGHRGGDPDDLPAQLIRDMADCSLGAPSRMGRVRKFPTEAEARAALAQVVLCHVRQKVGLDPLPA